MIAKTFFTALKEFHDNPQKVRKYFKDKRITHVEKKILECWFLLRDGKNNEIVSQLEKLPLQADELVESQKNLILGLALNNQGDFGLSIQKLETAAKALKKHNLPYYLYIAQSNLFNTWFNLKNKNGMKKAIFEMREIKAQNQRQEIIYLIFRMNYFSFCKKYHFATKQMNEIEKKRPLMSESIVINFMTSKFMHEIRCNQLGRANNILTEMKKFRKFHFNSNFKFMRMMLDHLLADKPLYVYDHDFDHSPINYHQIKVIQLLEESKTSDAHAHWQQLQELQPGVYEKPFQYKGDPCLFSFCLNKYNKKNSISQPNHYLSMPKEKWLYTVLQEIDQPIRKEELFRLIWGRPQEDKDDLNKLKVLISRIRDKFEVEITYKKGCYQLLSTSVKKKIA